MTTPPAWTRHAAETLKRERRKRVAGFEHEHNRSELGPPCDYCADGDTPVDGWHYLPDPEEWEAGAKVPCPRYTP